MQNVVTLLEQLGADAALAGAALEPRLEGLPRAEREALRARDAAGLRAALGVQATMACLVAVPNDDEKEFDDAPATPDELPDGSEVRAA